MLAKCPYCGASLRKDEADHLPARCWMCTAPLPQIPEAPISDLNQTIMMKAVGLPVKLASLRLDEKGVVDTPTLPENTAIKIAVEQGAQQGKIYEILRPLMTIGRLGGGADIEIDDPEVSRLHCSIEVRRDSILLQDLRSKNGTFHEGSRIFATRLDGITRFRIGGTLLRVDREPA